MRRNPFGHEARQLLVSGLVGLTVIDRRDSPVGLVLDALIEPTSGAVASLLIRVTYRRGAKRLLIPPRAAVLTGKELKLDITRHLLEEVPETPETTEFVDDDEWTRGLFPLGDGRRFW